MPTTAIIEPNRSMIEIWNLLSIANLNSIGPSWFNKDGIQSLSWDAWCSGTARRRLSCSHIFPRWKLLGSKTWLWREIRFQPAQSIALFEVNNKHGYHGQCLNIANLEGSFATDSSDVYTGRIPFSKGGNFIQQSTTKENFTTGNRT